MAKINEVVTARQPEQQGGFQVTLGEIAACKMQFISDNMTLSATEFAELFGKETKWALERMRDGSVTVLDEFAKVGTDGVRFSKSARVTAESVKQFRVSLQV